MTCEILDMKKIYVEPEVLILGMNTGFMNSTSPQPAQGTEVDPINPRNPEESLTHDRNGFDEIQPDDSEFSWGSIW